MILNVRDEWFIRIIIDHDHGHGHGMYHMRRTYFYLRTIYDEPVSSSMHSTVDVERLG